MVQSYPETSSLPQPPPLQSGMAASSPVSSGVSRPLRVLIADTDASSVHRLSSLLAAEDFEISTALDGEQAAAHLTRGRADIAVVDAGLVLDDGKSLVAHAKSWAPHVPLIAVSADASWETSQRVRIDGGPVFYYVLKPVELTEFREAILCAAATCRRERKEAT